MRFLEHLSHITAVMSERTDGPMGSSKNAGKDGEFGENRVRFIRRHGIDPREFVLAGLVQGITVRSLSRVPRGGHIADADGLVSFGPAVAIASQDCFPLFFAPLDPSDGHALVGIAHAGWPGVVEGIAARMVTELEFRGLDRRRNLAVAIGPGIRSCCFVVRDDERGLQQYRDRGYHDDFIEEAGVGVDGEKRWRVDLVGILLFQLRDQLFIPAERIEVAGPCTSCATDGSGAYRFSSWRRDGVLGANMLSAIRLATRRGTETPDR